MKAFRYDIIITLTVISGGVVFMLSCRDMQLFTVWAIRTTNVKTLVLMCGGYLVYYEDYYGINCRFGWHHACAIWSLDNDDINLLEEQNKHLLCETSW